MRVVLMEDRYRRISRVPVLGSGITGQLPRSRVLVVGCGALGSASAMLAVRMGAGRVRLVDRDIVEEANLSDQCLYSESDAAAHRTKAESAAQALAALNRRVEVEGVVADFSHVNAERLCEGIDLILDGSDNLETKYLLNDVAVALNIPWVYAGCAGTRGTILAVVPGRCHCLRCIWDDPPPRGCVDGCESMGMLPTTAFSVAAVQVNEALRILLAKDDDPVGGVISVDTWSGYFRKIPIPAFRPGCCPVCGARNFAYLGGRRSLGATALCGGQAVLVDPGEGSFDFLGVRSRLMARLAVTEGSDCLRFVQGDYSFLIFSSGRALIYGVSDTVKARALYGRYVAP